MLTIQFILFFVCLHCGSLDVLNFGNNALIAGYVNKIEKVKAFLQICFIKQKTDNIIQNHFTDNDFIPRMYHYSFRLYDYFLFTLIRPPPPANRDL